MMQKPVSQQGWEQNTSSKFGTSEQFHLIPTLQNRGTEFVAKYAPEERLHEQARRLRL